MPVKKLLLKIGCSLVLWLPHKGHAQDPITLLVKGVTARVIKAIDLEVQKIQTQTIWLQNAQKALENVMTKLKLDQIQDWVSRQKDLYQSYFDELYMVKDVLTYYHKVKEISEMEVALVNQYKKGLQAAAQDHHFSADEVLY